MIAWLRVIGGGGCIESACCFVPCRCVQWTWVICLMVMYCTIQPHKEYWLHTVWAVAKQGHLPGVVQILSSALSGKHILNKYIFPCCSTKVHCKLDSIYMHANFFLYFSLVNFLASLCLQMWFVQSEAM